MTQPRSESEILDVAIVGAGVAGVYTGWRLLTAPSPESRSEPIRNLAVFECSGRVGGRLLSVQPPGLPELWCELGGMRYTSAQPLVRSLVENRLKLATHPFPVMEPANLNYVRDTWLRNSQLTDTSLVPYDLNWSEQGQDPGSLVGNAIDQLIPGATQMSATELRSFLEHFQLDGRHIYDWGFWNLLARGMSHEAYEFARATGGYDTPSLNWNALDTISLNFDLSPGVTYSGLTGGYQSVPLTLATELEAAGGQIRLHHTVRSIEVEAQPDGDLIRLTVTDGGKGASGDDHQVLARAVVLAMPRRSLELLDPVGPIFGPDNAAMGKLLATVTPIPLFKVFLAYDFPWWEAAGVTQGRSQTDLPIRQCYYWGEGPARGSDPEYRKAVMLATYDDGENTAFWSGLTDPDHHSPFEPRHDRFTEQHPGSTEWRDCRPTAALVAEVDRQLKEMHDLRYAPKPYSAAYMDWSVDPFGGGVNFWNIHARSSIVVPRIAHPVDGIRAFICGEAYSNGQGWVEGALQTSELVLQKHFGLEPPDWVTGP